MDHANDPSLKWDSRTREQFELLLGKVPVFLRPVAKEKVLKRTERIVREANRNVIGEKDLVDAFFAETPFGFHGPLKADMTEFGIDYEKYGYSK